MRFDGLTVGTDGRGGVVPLRGLEPKPVEHRSPLDRLDDYRRDEHCAQDLVAEAISQSLYQKSYDELPGRMRASVEAQALRALRSVQGAWMSEAWTRAIRSLDAAMANEMGMAYAQQPIERRQALAYIGAQAVIAALVGTLELTNPFEGPVSALKVYDAAHYAGQRHIHEVK